MKTSLLFSSFPFIASEKVTLTRMTELDLNAMWEIMGDDDNYRFAPTAALRSPAECVLKLRQIEALFRDKAAITLILRDHHLMLPVCVIFSIWIRVIQVSLTS